MSLALLLRFGEHSNAANSLIAWVHNDSPGEGAEPEWSCTPTTEEEGGWERNGTCGPPHDSRSHRERSQGWFEATAMV